MATLSQLVQRCVTRLGMVGGTGVQVYAEDILAEMVQARFDVIFEAMWWEPYMDAQVAILAADGVVDADVQTGWGLKLFTDIKHVYYKTDTRPLPRSPGRLNATNLMKQGSYPLFIAPTRSEKVFKLMPYGDVGESVYVDFRVRPAPFYPDDEILLDDLAIIFGVCYDYLEDDGTNPGATEKYRNFYNERMEQLNASRNEQDIALIPGDGTIPDYWQQV